MTDSAEPAPEAAPLFRQEALEYHNAAESEGHVLRVSPRWIQWVYPLLLLVLAASFLYAAIGSTYEYAAGPALIRLEGRTELTARVAGTVSEVLARPGEHVQRGQLLVRFYLAAASHLGTVDGRWPVVACHHHWVATGDRERAGEQQMERSSGHERLLCTLGR